MKVKLTKEQKVKVRKWVNQDEFNKSVLCPFEFTGRQGCHKVCKPYFPKINVECSCPCSVYSLSTVIRRAKQMLEDGE